MNPEKYAKALKLTYSRLLSPEEVKPFLDAHYNGDSQALRVLKDRFQDEGDPRGDIWDRANGLTQAEGWGGGPGETTNKRGKPEDVSFRLGSDDDKHDFRFVVEPVVENYLLGQSNLPTHTRFTQIRTCGTDWHERSGVFTPEEARQLADKFPSPHVEQIHEFLDQHFPESKRTE